MNLIKISDKGWEKEFNTKLGVYIELEKHVCEMCIAEFFMQYGQYPQNANDLLDTRCGCEFMLEE